MSDLLDILTTEEAGAALNLNASRVPSNAEQIDQWVTAVSRALDERCGPVVVRTVENEVHDGYWPSIIPREQPVYSVTTVTEYSSTTPQTLIPENFPTVVSAYDYRLDQNGMIRRRSSGGDANFAGQVVVTYEAGRYADTASVDARFKAAAGMILRRLWAREAGAWARGGDAFAEDGSGIGFFTVVDAVVNEFLADQRRTTVIL